MVLDQDPGTFATWSDGWEIRITAGPYRFRFSPGAEPYALGTYVTSGVANGTDVGMTVEPTGLTGGCGSGQEGTFTLLELPEVDAGQEVTRFAADLAWRCIPYASAGDPERWLHASIRIGAATPPGLVTAPMTVTQPTTNVGAASTTTVTLTALGGASTSLGQVAVEGPDAAMHAIEDDGCSNATLAADTTCTFSVVFSPTSTQAKLAHLRVNGDSPVFDHVLRADGRGRSPLLDLPSEVVLNGDEGGWVIDGAAHRFTDAEVATIDGTADARSATVAFPGGTVSIAAPDPDQLGVGHYVVPPFEGAPIPNLAVSAFGHGCNWATGWFEVLEPPLYDTDGRLLSVAFDFEHHCEGTEPRVRGSVRFHTNLEAVDLLPPSGDVEIEGGSGFVGDDTVSIDLPAEDPSGVGEVRLSNDGVTWATRAYAATMSWSLTDPAHGGTEEDGTKTVYVRWRDGAGNTSFGTSRTIVLDTTVPTTTAPRRGFVAATRLDAGRIALRVPWSGSDPGGSGVVRYHLQQRTDDGAWSTVSGTLTSPAVVRSLATEHRYAFRVRAVDRAGNVGAWATGDTFRISRWNEGNPAVGFTGTWATVADSAYLNGAAKAASTAGSTASITATGRSIAWVSRMAPTRGAAEVRVNGVKMATVDLYDATYRNQQVVWVGSWTTAATRTVTIKVLGTAGRPRVDLDAFITAN